MSRLSITPFAILLIVLPVPGTVGLRLLLLAICFGIALWQWLRHPETRAPIPCKAAIGLWLAVCLASLAYAFDAEYTTGELKNELGYTMMAFFAFFVISKERKDAESLLWALGVGSAVLACWAISNWFTLGFRWDEGARHGGVGIVGTYLITIIPALAWVGAVASPQFRRLAWAFLGLALLLAALTMQRALWPVLAAQVAIAVIAVTRTRMLALSRTQAIAAVVLVMAIALAGLFKSQQFRYGDSAEENVQLATDSRLSFWPKVAAKIADSPLAGAGFGRSALRKATPDLIPAETPALWHAHNVFLNYGLSMGIPGMLALAGLFGGLGLFFWRGSSGEAAAAGIAGIAIVAEPRRGEEAGRWLRSRIEERFDWTRVTADFEALYDRLLESAR